MAVSLTQDAINALVELGKEEGDDSSWLSQRIPQLVVAGEDEKGEDDVVDGGGEEENEGFAWGWDVVGKKRSRSPQRREKIDAMAELMKSKERREGGVGGRKDGRVEIGGSGGVLGTASVSRGPPPRAPFFHRVPGTDFVVDGFRWRPRLGFLSHFHSDHFVGLHQEYRGMIYTTALTARLVKRRLGVKDSQIHILRDDGVEEDVEGVGVRVLPANHCPGAVMFVFRVHGRVYLHCGDFRFLPTLHTPLLHSLRTETVFLDTTYARHPLRHFPSQYAATQAVREIVLRYGSDPGVLFVFGAYVIGKEMLWMEAADALKEKVVVDGRRKKAMDDMRDLCIITPTQHSRITTDSTSARIRVLPMRALTLTNLQSLLKSLCQPLSTSQSSRPTPPVPFQRPSTLAKAPQQKRRKKKKKQKLAKALDPAFLAFQRRLQQQASSSSTTTTSSTSSSSSSSSSPPHLFARKFHSIVAFRATGWVAAGGGGGGGGEEEGGGGEGGGGVRDVRDDHSLIRKEEVIVVRQGAKEERVVLGVRERGGGAKGGGGKGKGGVTLFEVPYSEHSSFAELQQMLRVLSPKSIVPTVGCRSLAEAKTLVAALLNPTTTPLPPCPTTSLPPPRPATATISSTKPPSASTGAQHLLENFTQEFSQI